MKDSQSNAALFTRTLRLKVHPNAYPWLNAAAIEVNQIWNFANHSAEQAITRTDTKKKWLSGFDICNLTAGATNHFERIGADTIQRVCTEYAAKRNTVKRRRLKWRVSFGSRRSLGWVPFKAASLKHNGRALRFAGKTFRVFERERMGGVKWKQGCFAQDSVGDWWLCLPVEVEAKDVPAPRETVGIDLGLKTIATTSDGDKLDAGRWTHRYADNLANAQRRGHKKQSKRIHRKIARCRSDALHKFSREIVDQYQNIIVGDVSSARLAKTKMAKSVLDSGWGMLKNFLDYKSQQAARSFSVVSEKYTTRACSGCGALTGPAGRTGLAVRTWTCECGVTHDRDRNAALNILRSGQGVWPPFAGTSFSHASAAEPSISLLRGMDSAQQVAA